MSKKDNSKIVNTFIIIGIVFLIGSLVLMFTGNKNQNYIKDISFSEYKDKILEDKYNIFLFTSPTCSHCNHYKPYVNLVAKENDLTIYNVDLSNIEYDEYKDLHDSYTALRDQFGDNNNPVIPTPATIITKNGQEVASTLGDIGQKGFASLLKNNNIIK